ncbi:hypothetical protein A2Z33_00380 [Candidatus Gottesmanbacteria bacterium RBG_16_52_11]|uniref:Uncharacterized protein n=1 Tax=Candidatus Gottesmanbacteria bacterium RBG_16_52_11 TaxID=1798374 RepID=A0A1F5YMW5_9BACT|nr:MAG: hypothetical protein A2Z33_00380 [Candidatus Gottesmanbacteria bacterium RBG_16_52_11]
MDHRGNRNNKYPRIHSLTDLVQVLNQGMDVVLGNLNESYIEPALLRIEETVENVYIRRLNAQRARRQAINQTKVLALKTAQTGLVSTRRALSNAQQNIADLAQLASYEANMAELWLRRILEPFLSTNAAVEAVFESVKSFLGFTIVRNVIRDDRTRKTYGVFDLSGMTQQEVQNLVFQLHDASIPFRLLDCGDQTDSGISAHIRWFLSESIKNRQKIAQYMPGIKIDPEWWVRQYLEVANSIAATQTRWIPYLVLPEWSLNENFRLLSGRMLSRAELVLFLHRMFNMSTGEKVMDALVIRDEFQQMMQDTILPERLDIRRDGFVRAESGSGEETWYAMLSLGAILTESFDDLGFLRSLLLPLLDENHRISLISDVYPVPAGSRRAFLKVIRKRVNRLKRSLGKDVVTKAFDNYVSAMDGTYVLINESQSQTFGRRTIIVLQAKTQDAINALKKQVVDDVLRKADIFQTPVRKQLHLASEFRRLVPVGPGYLDLDELYADPEIGVENAILRTVIPVPTKGTLVGAFTEGNTGFIIGKKIVGLTGGQESGKSTLAKIAVWNFMLLDPSHRVWVVDNSGVTPRGDTRATKALREEQLKGWGDIRRAFGGIIVFADDYKTPGALYKYLQTLEDNRFVLYYPAPNREGHDIEFLNWQVSMFKKNADPRSHTEEDVQAIAVYDDCLSWFKDPNNPVGQYWILYTINELKKNGVQCFIAMQTPIAIEKANPAAHSLLITVVDIWVNFATSSHGDIAGGIGIRPITREGETLIQDVSHAMSGIARGRIYRQTKARMCEVVIANILHAEAQIFCHPDVLGIISRMADNGT